MEDIWEEKKKKRKKKKGKNRYKQERMSNQPHDRTNREWERRKKRARLTGIHLERADARCLEDPEAFG
jgi:hypothetical protein